MSALHTAEGATRAVYWHIAPIWPMYVLFAICMVVFGYGVYRRARFWRFGLPAAALGDRMERVKRLWADTGLHRRLRRDSAAGWMHAAVVGSMALLFLGTLVVLVHVDFGIPVMQGWFYLVFQKLLLTVAGVFLGIACAVGLARRYVLGVSRLQPNRPAAARDYSHAVSLIFLLVLVIEGFGLQGIRLAARPDPYEIWSPVGYALSGALHWMDGQHLVTAYQVLWWTHLVTVLTWIAWLPYGKMLHIITAPLNIYSSDPEQPRRPEAIDFDNAQTFGVSRIDQLSWKDLLDLDACTSCGRCQQVCPAFAAGTPLNPRSLILDLRDHLHAQGRTYATGTPSLVGGIIAEEALWSCTTCGACVQECPTRVEHVPKILEMRRHLTMEEARIPGTLQEALTTLENRGHPYKGVAGDRTEWSRGLDVPLATDGAEYDVLYWVGCTASFDPRSQKVARALVQVLQKAGLNVAVLGNQEQCCGDPARRMGHELLYDTYAKTNIELLQTLKPKRIVTACPHCFNALGNEYRQLGGQFEVMHHSQLLAELVAAGKLPVDHKLGESVTFHDPCYLGRYGGEYDAPRAVIDATGARQVEMESNRSKSACCGGGGGQAWMPTPPQTRKVIRINERRAEHAVRTGADTLAVGCPFCMRMLEDGVKSTPAEHAPVVKDIAEILLQAVTAAGNGEETRADEVALKP